MDSEVPRKKITLPGLRKLFKLYSYIKPYKYEYGLGLLFLLGSSSASLVFPKLLGELVDLGNQGKLAQEINRIVLLYLLVNPFSPISGYSFLCAWPKKRWLIFVNTRLTI